MRLRWTNAGHSAGILARRDGTVIRLEKGGPAFSRLFRDTPYEESEVALEPGDRLVLFTDGVSEAAGPDGELFGEERIEALVSSAPAANAADLRQRLVDAAVRFSGGNLEDDVTVVVATIQGHPVLS
jgi:sigma-B regulation protein RsbU (phosphoserine phosphatase)